MIPVVYQFYTTAQGFDVAHTKCYYKLYIYIVCKLQLVYCQIFYFYRFHRHKQIYYIAIILMLLSDSEMYRETEPINQLQLILLPQVI